MTAHAWLARRMAGLSLLGALAAQAQGAPKTRFPPEAMATYPDGGTIRASGIAVPKALQDARTEPPAPPLSLFALASPEVLGALGAFQPDIGSWTEYSISTHGHETGRVLISVLPPPMPGGRYWLEIDTANASSLPMAVRILAHGDPSRRENIERAIVQLPGQAPFEIPFAALPTPVKPDAPVTGVKTTPAVAGKVKVQAGEFSGERIHLARGKESFTVWRSSAVPLYGLVRSEGGGIVTELHSTGRSGAHSLMGPILDENIPPPAREEAAQPAPAQGNGSDSK